MSNINNFLTHFSSKGEFSKTARFEAQIILPQGIPGDARNLRLQCEAAELPGYNINTVEGRVYGAAYQVAATPVYNELRLSFICAGDLSEKIIFEQWMDLILPMGLNSPNKLYQANYRSNYISTISVTQYYEYGILNSQSVEREKLASTVKNAAIDATKNSILSALGIPQQPSNFNNKSSDYATNLDNVAAPAYKVTFEEVFPYSIEPISLNWQDDGINRLNVAFKYKKWKRESNAATTNQFADKGLSLNDKLQQGLTTISSIKSLLR